MINEVIEVRNYLDGKNINKINIYRICYLLAKYYHERGLKNVEIRQAIFDWANKNELFIKYNINKIIYAATADKTRLHDNIVIKISDKDVTTIKERFDGKNARLVSLALLCYAKAYADKNKMFGISINALASWLNMNAGNLSARTMKELVDFEYITKVSTPKNNYKWDNIDTTNKYKIEVDLTNRGEHILVDNDVYRLYAEVFQ